MTSIFFADSNPKIRKLKDNKSYPVQPKSGLSLVKKPISFAGPSKPDIIRNLLLSPIKVGIAFFLSNKSIFLIYTKKP